MLQRLRTAAYYAALGVAGYKLVTHVNSLREPEHVLLASREAGLGAAASELELTPHHFLSKQRLLIFTRRWLTTNARAKGNVFIVHGLGEHMGRYEHVAAALTAAGFNVFGVDHQGHGRSEGERGYIKAFEDMVTDYCQFVDLTLAEAGGQFSALPSFLLGHSMGGLLTLNIARARAQVWRGAVVSAPALKADPDQVPPALIKLNLIVSAILPKITTVPLDVSTLCHDEAVVAAYHNDPLVCHAPMKARLGAELGSAMEATLGAAKSFTLPFLLMHGTADKMCLPAGSQEFYDTAASSDKKLVMLDGLFHEIMNEPERNEVISEMVAWINARL